jgi:hypothetical protein
MFLRTAGLKDGERVRAIRERAAELHQTVRKWTEHVPVNLPYVDLLFAFGMAKLGEGQVARKLIHDAGRVLQTPLTSGSPDSIPFNSLVENLTNSFLFRGFQYRIDQALNGKPHGGALSNQLLEEFETFTRKENEVTTAKQAGTTPHAKTGSSSADNPYRRTEYLISRMRQDSWIFDPEVTREPYAMYLTAYGDPLAKELLDLGTIREPKQFAERVRKLYRGGFPGKSPAEVRFFLLHEAFPLAPRVGESFCIELLELVSGPLSSGPGDSKRFPESELVKKQGELLERSLFVAAHFGLNEHVQKLVVLFLQLVRSKTQDARFQLINVVASQCLRSLKKLGMRDQIERFLSLLQSEVIRDSSLIKIRKSYDGNLVGWVPVLRTLLSLATGWLTFGLNEQAEPILDQARQEILGPAPLPTSQYPDVVRSYISTLGHLPAESGLPRFRELFERMNPAAIPNSWTGNHCYSRLHLRIVEEVILALISDDFALGPAGRRWLDDDEFLVRRRIHDDMRRYVAGLG